MPSSEAAAFADLGDFLGVLVGAAVTLFVTWRTESRASSREETTRRREERERRIDEATDLLASINSITWEVSSTPAPELLKHPERLDAIQARWAAVRPVLFRMVVTYDSDAIRDSALQLVTELTRFLGMAGIRMSDPEKDPDEFERDANERQDLRRRVDVLTHALFARIHYYLEPAPTAQRLPWYRRGRGD